MNPVKNFFKSDVSMLTTIGRRDRKSTRLNSSHGYISYAVFCLKKKKAAVAAAALCGEPPLFVARAERALSQRYLPLARDSDMLCVLLWNSDATALPVSGCSLLV